MHLEVDYTDDLAELDETEEQELWTQSDDGSEGISEKKLKHFMDYCRQLRGQTEDGQPLGKRERLVSFFEAMKRVAYIHSGRLALDIDEENFQGRLMYWGRCLAFMDGESGDTKDIVVELMNQYQSVFIEPRRGGIRLTVETDLFDEPMNENDREILDRIRKELREMK